MMQINYFSSEKMSSKFSQKAYQQMQNELKNYDSLSDSFSEEDFPPLTREKILYNPKADGHCFYHSMAKIFIDNPKLLNQINKYKSDFQKRSNTKQYALFRLIRFAVSRKLTKEDLEAYQTLSICEPIPWLEEHPNPSLEEFQDFIGIATDDHVEYANEITIQAFLNLFPEIGLIVTNEQREQISLENWKHSNPNNNHELMLVDYGHGNYHYKIWI